MTWLVVHTKPRSEEQASEQLKRQGYTVYLPRIRERKRRQNRREWVTSALFPRYVFVDVALGEQTVQPIRSTIGVSGIVQFGHVLASVPSELVECIRMQEIDESGAIEKRPIAHSPGDKVEILDGPFEGIKGVYQLNKGDDRALVLINLLGRKNLISIEEAEIARAS